MKLEIEFKDFDKLKNGSPIEVSRDELSNYIGAISELKINTLSIQKSEDKYWIMLDDLTVDMFKKVKYVTETKTKLSPKELDTMNDLLLKGYNWIIYVSRFGECLATEANPFEELRQNGFTTMAQYGAKSLYPLQVQGFTTKRFKEIVPNVKKREECAKIADIIFWGTIENRIS